VQIIIVIIIIEIMNELTSVAIDNDLGRDNRAVGFKSLSE
jgi:hypothetical protein